MCGIAGLFSYAGNLRVDNAVLTRMRDTMQHRGPDGGSNWIDPEARVGLAHRRLSIIDLSNAASQPMTNADGSVWVSFNGEIYNHVRLRHELVAQGYVFRTDHSDTEVLVHGYRAWGIDGLLSRLEGDYAVAIWDVTDQKLLLFRDRIGVKPLYFALQNGAILFASEIKALLQHPVIPRDVEPIAVYHYLSFLTTPAPFTMFRGIFKLPAGHAIEVSSADGFKAWRYWDAVPGQGIEPGRLNGMHWPAREQFYVDGIRDRLNSAVEKRMMSDVPFGVFLSGGIDSSTNVALMSRYLDRPVDTFTVGFKDFEHLNELSEARLVANKFKTNHHEVLIEESDMRGYLADLIHTQDEPIADWVCIPLYFVSKLAKDSGVTVVQVGEGSDEQFCGYASYMGYLDLYKKYWSPFRSYVPSPLRHVAAGIANAAARVRPGLDTYADIIDRASRNREHFWSGASVFPETTKRRLVDIKLLEKPQVPQELIATGLIPANYLSPDSFAIIDHFKSDLAQAAPEHDILARMTYSEFKLRLPELLLMRVDKIGMSVSLEARVPFLDNKLVEFALDIPMADKVHNNVPKYLLKKAVEGIIPDEIIYRKKMGFGAPMQQWLRGDFGRYVEDIVMSSKALKRCGIKSSMVQSFFDAHRSGKGEFSLYIWCLFNFVAWYDYWIEQGGQ